MPIHNPPQPRRGFAIPVAILLIAVLSISLGAGFMLVNTERRSVTDDRAQVDALRLAQQGMQVYLVRRDSLGFHTNPPVAAESARVTLTGGYADVILTRIQAGSAPLYVVRSRGVETSTFANIPLGVRTVAQYATTKSVSFNVRGAWTSLNGVSKNGSSGTLSGVDACNPADTIAGLALPTSPGYSQNGSGTWPSSISNFAPTPDSAATLTPIDWNGILNNGAITPTVTFPSTSPAWPSFSDTTYWPTILITGSGTATLSSGRGLLIVQGSLDMNGSVTWDGVILVGGMITGDGNNTVNGAIISGLNVKLNPGQASQTNSVGNGTKNLRYNSCSVSKALGGLGRLTLYANTWSDSWPGY